MRTISTVAICAVIAQAIGGAASLPAHAEPGRSHGLAPHHAARHVRSRSLTVRRHARRPVEITRDFDPVPPDPLIMDVFRGLDGYDTYADAYGPQDLDQPFGPRVFRDF